MPVSEGREESSLSGNPGASRVGAGGWGRGGVDLAGVLGGRARAHPAPTAIPSAPPSGQGEGLRAPRISQCRLEVLRRVPSTRVLRPGGSGLRWKRGWGAPSRIFPRCAHAWRERACAGGGAGLCWLGYDLVSCFQNWQPLLEARLLYPSPKSLPRLPATSGWVPGSLAGLWSARAPGGPKPVSSERPRHAERQSKPRTPGELGCRSDS